MDANIIKSRVDATWQDASTCWKDEYASRYRVAVVTELENTLDRIRNTSMQLSDSINIALASLREIED